MGLSNFLLGWQICERLNIPLLKLSELCHTGKLTAYRFEDRRQVQVSSQCNTKFKYSGNTTFTMTQSKGTSIIAISKKATEYFSLYIDRKLNNHTKQDSITRPENGPMGAILKASKKNTAIHIKNIREMRIKFCDSEYIVFYNNLTASPLIKPAGINRVGFRLYGTEKVFFELGEKECEIDLEYLELNDYSNGGIKRSVTTLRIKKIQDSFGNKKFILSEYDERKIQIKSQYYIKNSIFVDTDRLKHDESYFFEYENYRAYFQQYAVDYFHKEDSLYSRPLKHEVDFFIFDYDEYKKRFHFLEDEETSQKNFFNYIKNLVFDESEIKNEISYDMAVNAIKQDPQKYMIEKCVELKARKDNYDTDTFRIIKAYHMAITGSSWKEIHKELWEERGQDQPANDKFISGKLGKFESIAKLNRLPYVKAKLLRDMKASEKESIVKAMLEQLATFYEGK